MGRGERATLEKELTYEGQTCFLGSWDWAGTGSTCVCWRLGGGRLKFRGMHWGAQLPLGAFQTHVIPFLWAFALLEFALTMLQLIAER